MTDVSVWDLTDGSGDNPCDGCPRTCVAVAAGDFAIEAGYYIRQGEAFSSKVAVSAGEGPAPFAGHFCEEVGSAAIGDKWGAALQAEEKLQQQALHERSTAGGGIWDGDSEDFEQVLGQKAVASDARLKTNITLVATSPAGIPIYTFQYTPQGHAFYSSLQHVQFGNLSNTVHSNKPLLYRGVMAQDLLGLPQFAHAVIKNPNGFYSVDYSLLDVRAEQVREN